MKSLNLIYRLLSGLNREQWSRLKDIVRTIELNQGILNSQLRTALRRGKPCHAGWPKSGNRSLKISFPESRKGYLTGEMKISLHCEDRKLFDIVERMLRNTGVLVEPSAYPYFNCIMGGETATRYHDVFHQQL